MDKNRKKLLISIILVVLYFALLGSLNQLFTGDKSNDLINMVTILLSFVCIIYESILIFNKNIDTLIVERVIIDEKACSYLV